MSVAYSKSFFAGQQSGSKRSAEAIVPMAMDLLKPKSVVDVGCGVGTWLSVFQSHGAAEILGIDGSYVDLQSLHIQPEHFQSHDLTKPLRQDRSFDLVVSLEVAEHLPASAAATFVRSLVSLGPVILFSAAIPHQGGTHHVNEQWPEYWAELFKEQGYQVIDCLRHRIWKNRNVDWCYAQNILIYARQTAIEANPALRQAWTLTDPNQLALVHPLKFLEQCDPNHITVRRLSQWLPVLLKGLPTIFANAAKRHFPRGGMSAGPGKSSSARARI
jgi:SAM-dependent methyltransferase